MFVRLKLTSNNPIFIILRTKVTRRMSLVEYENWLPFRSTWVYTLCCLPLYLAILITYSVSSNSSYQDNNIYYAMYITVNYQTRKTTNNIDKLHQIFWNVANLFFFILNRPKSFFILAGKVLGFYTQKKMKYHKNAWHIMSMTSYMHDAWDRLKLSPPFI
jgi:hypothetical protein